MTARPTRTERRDPLRVCMIHFSNFPVDSRVQRQAHALASRGDEVDCVCISGPQTIVHGPGRIRVHNVGVSKRRGGPLTYIAAYATFFARAMRMVARLDADRRFDLIEVHNMPNFLTFAGAPARRRGAPILLDVHDTFPELFSTRFGLKARHPATRAVELEERLSGGYASAMMCVTHQAARRLNERGVCIGRTATVMNSPDEAVFGPPREPHLISPTSPIRAIYHGGLAPRFGIETLIVGVGLLRDRYPQLSLTVCGADHETSSTAALAREHAPSNVFVEARPTPFQQIPKVLERCHLGIVPTARDEFTDLLLPVKLLEYIHMGLPVVSSRLPVIAEHFTDEEVRFFEPDDPESLAEAVAGVIDDPAAAQARAQRALVRLRDFAWASQRGVYLGVVDGLVNQPVAA